jgi:hypothetical protein
MKQVEHAPDEQTGAEQESETESGLGNYKGVLEAVPASTGSRGRAAIPQGGSRMGMRNAPRREQSEDECGGSGEQEREEKHPEID